MQRTWNYFVCLSCVQLHFCIVSILHTFTVAFRRAQQNKKELHQNEDRAKRRFITKQQIQSDLFWLIFDVSHACYSYLALGYCMLDRRERVHQLYKDILLIFDRVNHARLLAEYDLISVSHVLLQCSIYNDTHTHTCIHRKSERKHTVWKWMWCGQ